MMTPIDRFVAEMLADPVAASLRTRDDAPPGEWAGISLRARGKAASGELGGSLPARLPAIF
jgi:hypothetical protein